MKKETEKMEVIMFGKKYELSQKELEQIYRGVKIRNPELMADIKFSQLRKEKWLEELKKRPEDLLKYIMDEMYGAIITDYTGYSKEADDLIQFLPEEQLKELEPRVHDEYKDTIDRVRKERAEGKGEIISNKVPTSKKVRVDDEESEYSGKRISVKLFGKKYKLTVDQLAELYEEMGIRNAEYKAEETFDDLMYKEERRKLLRNPEALLEYIISSIMGHETLDLGATSWEALKLMERLPEEQLKKLEPQVHGVYKDKIDEVRMKRAKKNSSKDANSTNNSNDEIEFE